MGSALDLKFLLVLNIRAPPAPARAPELISMNVQQNRAGTALLVAMVCTASVSRRRSKTRCKGESFTEQVKLLALNSTFKRVWHCLERAWTTIPSSPYGNSQQPKLVKNAGERLSSREAT
jgi:hypothetical protein